MPLITNMLAPPVAAPIQAHPSAAATSLQRIQNNIVHLVKAPTGAASAAAAAPQLRLSKEQLLPQEQAVPAIRASTQARRRQVTEMLLDWDRYY
jgi:hypothetical protein